MESYGFLSLLPPIVAIVIAFWLRNVLIALFLGVYTGAIILMDGNPFTALTSTIRDFIFHQASGGYNSSMMVLMTFIGGFVAVMTRSGAGASFANRALKLLPTRARVQVATWIGGLIIFFTDSGNSLILGPIFQPLADKMRISREKLAWILDATASPVCILVPVIGWGIYIMGLIHKEYVPLGITESEWTAFMKALPFQFYALTTLAMVPLVALLGREYGPMYKAEKRTIELGLPTWPDAKPLRLPIDVGEASSKATMDIILLPLIVLFAIFFGILIYYGFPVKKVPGIVLRTALTTGYLVGAVLAMFLIVSKGVKDFSEVFADYVGGMKEMVFILAILVLAWSIGSVCKKLGTAHYIIQLAQGTIPPWSIPVIIFITGAVISFATGTSWGTFAILMPLAIPIAYKLGAPVHVSIAAVLSGGLFGDHCSPISDTTILASMGAACDLIDHVKTQVYYGLTAAAASAVSYIVAGATGSASSLILAIILVTLFIYVGTKLWGSKVPNLTFNDIEKLPTESK